MPSPQSSQRNPERTRRRILQAATKLFAKSGYHAVSVDEIVGSVSVNKRMVYHYFGSKDKLFEAVLATVYQRVEETELRALEEGKSAKERLSRLIEGYFKFLAAQPEFTRLLLWENLEKGRHLTKENHSRSKNPFFEKFTATVEEGVEKGEFRSDLDVPHLLIQFIGLCFIYHSNRYSLSHCFGINLGKPEVRQAGLEQVLKLVFDGITKPKPKRSRVATQVAVKSRKAVPATLAHA